MANTLSSHQFAALTKLARGPFVQSVAGWHHPNSGGIGAFQTQTILALENDGLAFMARREARITRRGKAFLAAEAEAAARKSGAIVGRALP
jgi:hypothetical protein